MENCLSLEFLNQNPIKKNSSFFKLAQKKLSWPSPNLFGARAYGPFRILLPFTVIWIQSLRVDKSLHFSSILSFFVRHCFQHKWRTKYWLQYLPHWMKFNYCQVYNETVFVEMMHSSIGKRAFSKGNCNEWNWIYWLQLSTLLFYLRSN